MEPALRLQPGQRGLTPEQEAEARRFAEAYIQRQLSTEPVDEEETEAFLWQAYEATGLTPPHHIHWLDGPLELVAALAREYEWIEVDDLFTERVSHCVWDDLRREGSQITRSLRGGVKESIDYRVRSVHRHAKASIGHRLGLRKGDKLAARVWGLIAHTILESVQIAVGEHLAREVAGSFKHPDSDWPWDPDRIWSRWESEHETCRWHSICAYDEAVDLAYLHYFDTYAVPNQAHALAHFNERVCGYWLGKEVALLVRQPKVLSRDAAGRLHSETGQCIAYRDGWGCYAWHGVRVDEKVILAPESLTGKDFLKERNVEVRRVMQERMGSRFVAELGVVIDQGARGTLYEVALPEDDPEQVAHYVKVQDASTARQYVLRVPPTIQTATEAVAWSFGLSVEAYHPAQET